MNAIGIGQHNHQQGLVNLVAVLTLFLGIGSLLFDLYLWWRFHLHIPIHDQAAMLPLVINLVENGFSSTTLYEWIAPHASAHRIATTRLFMSLDYLYAHGQNHVIYASTLASIVTLLLVNIRAFTTCYPSEKSLVAFMVGFSLIFLSSQSQFWNLINPINSSWYVALATGALSISLITNKPTLPTAGYLAAAFSLAAIAAFSNFLGAIVWLVLPIVIALRSIRAGLFAVIAAALFLGLYLPGISPDTAMLATLQTSEGVATHQAANSPNSPGWLTGYIYLAKNTLAFLGSPLSITHPQVAIILVIASVLGLICGWFALLRHRLFGQYKHNAWLEFNLAVSTVCLGTAWSCSLGRVLTAAPTSQRYQTVVMVYWLCVGGLAMGVGLKKYGSRPFGRLALMVLCLATSALFLNTSAFPPASSLKVAKLAHQMSYLDDAGIPSINLTLHRTNTVYLNGYSPIFKRHHLSHMVERDQHIETKSSARCANVVLYVSPSRWPGILRIGATIDDYGSKLYREIAFSDERGNLKGFLWPIFTDAKLGTSSVLQRKSEWEGFVKSTFDPKQDIYLHYRSSPFAESSCRVSL